MSEGGCVEAVLEPQAGRPVGQVECLGRARDVELGGGQRVRRADDVGGDLRDPTGVPAELSEHVGRIGFGTHVAHRAERVAVLVVAAVGGEWHEAVGAGQRAGVTQAEVVAQFVEDGARRGVSVEEHPIAPTSPLARPVPPIAVDARSDPTEVVHDGRVLQGIDMHLLLQDLLGLVGDLAVPFVRTDSLGGVHGERTEGQRPVAAERSVRAVDEPCGRGCVDRLLAHLVRRLVRRGLDRPVGTHDLDRDDQRRRATRDRTGGIGRLANRRVVAGRGCAGGDPGGCGRHEGCGEQDGADEHPHPPVRRRADRR